MALNLDPRQREMLKEMGITLWLAPAARPQPAHARPGTPAPAAAEVTPLPPSAPPLAPPRAATAAPDKPTPAASGWALAPARAAYPQAPAQPGQPGWLVLAECEQADDPWAGAAGQLLAQMLQALRLQHNPQVFIAPVQPAGSADATLSLHEVLQHTRPALVLALGLPAARLALGGQAPLGRLRASPQSGPDGVPVVVSYAPHHLLRAPAHKGAAWADLCRAHTLAHRPASA
ncbi:MAG: hypothetical protein LWW82_07835 [Comamonadaceae bacterium]|nr:hypothetical protein [Comamonadaceae bacterium]